MSSKMDNIEILYGTRATMDELARRTEEVLKDIEGGVHDGRSAEEVEREKADAELARICRDRGAKAWEEGHDNLARALREVWRLLTK